MGKGRGKEDYYIDDWNLQSVSLRPPSRRSRQTNLSTTKKKKKCFLRVETVSVCLSIRLCVFPSFSLCSFHYDRTLGIRFCVLFSPFHYAILFVIVIRFTVIFSLLSECL